MKKRFAAVLLIAVAAVSSLAAVDIRVVVEHSESSVSEIRPTTISL